MIDKENEVYTIVRNAVKAQFPDADIDSSYQPIPSGFPHVSFYQQDFSTPADLLDSSAQPKFQDMMFDAQVYSNLTAGKKQEAKKIMEIIVDTMQAMNFRMIMLTPVPNLNDSSIYRLTARFEGRADEGGFYRR